MEPVNLITIVVSVLSQVVLLSKGAETFIKSYGDDAIRIGKQIYNLVKSQLESKAETQGEFSYFEGNPEQEKRQQAIADSLSNLVEENEVFRKELERLVTQYEQIMPQEAVEEIRKSVQIKFKVGGDFSGSMYVAGRDINVDD